MSITNTIYINDNNIFKMCECGVLSHKKIGYGFDDYLKDNFNIDYDDYKVVVPNRINNKKIIGFDEGAFFKASHMSEIELPNSLVFFKRPCF